MILLTKLFLAHIIGDFFLQPLSWVKDKETKKLRSWKLYIHILSHAVLLFLILWDFSKWLMIIVISLSHFIIDILKLYAQKGGKSRRYWFFIDQLLHVTAIIATYLVLTDNSFTVNMVTSKTILLLCTCLLFLTQPASLILQVIFGKWNIEELTKDNQSLKDAGKYIGILERILVFVFIITSHWEAVGFLITAKSVFRFGDLKESKDRKLTEYILIGTLVSFSMAIATGMLFTYITN